MMQPQQLGPFRVVRTIGRGGMGAVYEAVHTVTNEVAAVKVLLGMLEEEEEMRLRFETEIETLKRLRHPNIVRLYGFGEEGSMLYYVMELVDGQSLHQELRRQRFFQWYEVAKIGLEMCQALKHAHDRGITHRDIKPANILLEKQGTAKLSDYGIAHFFGGQRLTGTNSVVGTLEYMSPEQALSQPIGPKSDMYSLGAVLYALLVGRPPYAAKALPEILRKHATMTLEPLRAKRLDVPEAFEAVISELLKTKPEERPGNVYLVARRIQSLLQAMIGPPEDIFVYPGESKAVQPASPKKNHDAFARGLDSPPSPLAQTRSQEIIDLGELVAGSSDKKPADDQEKHSEALPVSPGASESGDPVLYTTGFDLTPEISSPATPTRMLESAETSSRPSPEPEDEGDPVQSDTGKRTNREIQHDEWIDPRSETSSEKDTPVSEIPRFADSEATSSSPKSSSSADSTALFSQNIRLSPEENRTKRSDAKVSDSRRLPRTEAVRSPQHRPTPPAIREAGDEHPVESLKSREQTPGSDYPSPFDAVAKQEIHPPHSPAFRKMGQASSRFVEVGDRDLLEFDTVPSVRRPWISPQTILLLAALVLSFLFARYMIQPVPADVLYARIKAEINKTDGDHLASLRRAEGNIQSFLDDYPDHSFAEEILGYKEELELAAKERLYERGYFSKNQEANLHPAERAYAEAIALSRSDPDAAIVKLKAIITLYRSDLPEKSAGFSNGRVEEHGEDGGATGESSSERNASPLFRQKSKEQTLLASPAKACVFLAERRLAMLEKDRMVIIQDLVDFLNRRLDDADQLEPISMARAQEIRRSLIQLYEGRTWAAPVIARARQQLENAETTEWSAPPPHFQNK